MQLKRTRCTECLVRIRLEHRAFRVDGELARSTRGWRFTIGVVFSIGITQCSFVIERGSSYVIMLSGAPSPSSSAVRVRRCRGGSGRGHRSTVECEARPSHRSGEGGRRRDSSSISISSSRMGPCVFRC